MQDSEVQNGIGDSTHSASGTTWSAMVRELIWKLWKELIWEQAEKSKEVSCERGTKSELEIIDRSICFQQVDCCELG